MSTNFLQNPAVGNYSTEEKLVETRKAKAQVFRRWSTTRTPGWLRRYHQLWRRERELEEQLVREECA